MNKKNLISRFLLALMIIPVFAPVLAYAQDGSGLLPSCGADGSCGWVDLVQLGQNIITFLLILSIPIATIAFAWAGILMLTASGNEGQIDKAKEIFWKVLKGFLFALTAWLIVRLITSELLIKDNYVDLLVKQDMVIKSALVLEGSFIDFESDTIKV